MTSDVLPGSGLSSSASVEVLIGTIINALYNDNRISNEDLAKIGQWAENKYFGKPCGLMDQMACAVGGIIAIDFKDSSNPIVEKVEFDFESQGYKLLIVDTGGNHEDLTENYASIPKDMKKVANLLGKQSCREIDYQEYLDKLMEIRDKIDDRAALRVFHFIHENERVKSQVHALRQNNFAEFLNHVEDSGNSSFKWLQNIYSTKNAREQGLTLALALTETYLAATTSGACRVHGGGFAGTIQVYLQDEHVAAYVDSMEKIFGENSVYVLSIRSYGTAEIR
jgi:galactokinase